jgi:hypothetical protein
MATVPAPTTKSNKAFRCTVYDEPGTLGKVDGVIYFFGDDGQIVEFEPDMAPWTCILAEVGLAAAQALADRRHGGAVKIALTRQMEVA